MNSVIRPTPLCVKAGVVMETTNRISVEFGDDHFAEHMAIYGGTGKGKSKFVELILRQIIDQNRGACVIDPHGDLVEDLLAYIMRRKDALDPRLLSRIHYFEPGSPKHRFSFDPFRYVPLDDGGDDYDDWLKAKVESTARAIIRKQGEADFQGRTRLEMYLTAVLYCVGTRLNADGDHFPLSDAPVFLDKAHRDHPAKFKKVASLLPRHILSDLEEALGIQSIQRRRELLGSTIGRLRSFFTPVVSSLFTSEANESLDFRQIIEEQGIMLVNLRRTRSFSIDQGNAIGGLFINEILEAAQTANRLRRMPFFLFIDEASRFVGQDLMDALGQFRKMKLSLCLAVQDLSSLQGKDVDMAPKTISQCGIQICFQQKFPDDVEKFAKLFGIPSLDFDPLLHEVDRPDGYMTIDTIQTAYNSAERTSEGSSKGATDQFSGYLHRTGFSVHATNSSGNDKSIGRTDTHGTQYLSKTRVDIQETGRLRRAVMDQLFKKMSDIMRLGKGEAMVFATDMPPFTLKVHHVDPAFPTSSPDMVAGLLEKYKARIFKGHPYTFIRAAAPQFPADGTDFPDPPASPSPF